MHRCPAQVTASSFSVGPPIGTPDQAKGGEPAPERSTQPPVPTATHCPGAEHEAPSSFGLRSSQVHGERIPCAPAPGAEAPIKAIATGTHHRIRWAQLRAMGRATTMRHRTPLARLASTASLALAVLAAIPGPAAAALIRLHNARLHRGRPAVVTATILWNHAAALEQNMTVGDVRLVAVSRHGSRPTQLAASTFSSLPTQPRQRVRYVLRSAVQLTAIRRGNRVVLTASQHAFNPSPLVRTPVTYVTVAQVQAGPHRGRIGRFDCSDSPIVAQARLVGCDLVGAYLGRARVSSPGFGTRLETADLTGADLRQADLTRSGMAGARVNGADASGAIIDRVSLAHAEGTGLIARGKDTQLLDSTLFDAYLVDADFEGATFKGTSLGHANLQAARLTGASVSDADLTVSRLVGADLRNATIAGPTLYFTNLTDAKLRGAKITPSDPAALQWALLCRTEMPTAREGVENRDCTG